jgi:hypothetical protein
MDGELIFSKMALSRLLKPGELESILTELIGPPYENYLDHVPEVADERGMPTVGRMMAMKKNAEREATYKAEAVAPEA